MTPSSRTWVYLAAGLRAVAIGFVSVYLGFDLQQRGFGPFGAGAVIGAGPLGNMLAALVVAVVGPRARVKLLLLVFSLLPSACGFVLMRRPPLPEFLLLAGVGMVNGMGKDRGGLRALDQTVLAGIAAPGGGALAFAHYNVVTDVGLAVGAGLAGLPGMLRTEAFAGYAMLFLFSALAYAPVNTESVPSRSGTDPPRAVSAPSRKKIVGLSALFSLDSVGGGFLTSSLIAYWFLERFHAAPWLVSSLFFSAHLLNMISNYGSVWMTRKIGFIRTMVFTHLPSSLLLIAAALSPWVWLAAALFLLRESMVQMDVPAREAYVMAIVEPHERPFAAAVTNMVRNLGWAVGPLLGGAGMAGLFPGFSLVAGSSLKILYDMLLYARFDRVKPLSS